MLNQFSYISKRLKPTRTLQVISNNIGRTENYLHLQSSCYKLKKYEKHEFDQIPEFEYVGKRHTASTKVLTWGHTLQGAIGRASFLKPNKDKKQKVFPFVWKPHRLEFGEIFEVKDITCGYGFTLFAVKSKEGPSCYGTGNNTDGQLGLHRGHTKMLLKCLIMPASLKPSLEKEDKIIKVSAGRAHSLMLSKDNKVYSVGNNAYGQCGRPIIEEEDYEANIIYTRIRELDDHNICQLECGQDSSFALTDDGKLFSCGWSADGQTGRGHYENQSIMGLIKGDIEGENIVKVSCRADCILALNDKGQVFGWGNSEYRQLSLITDEKQINIPAHLPLPSHLGKIKDIASSGSSCFIISESGELYSWGYGHLGRGRDNLFCDNPTLIPPTLFGANLINPDTKVESVTCGINNVAVINSNRGLFMWGKNTSGSLGLGFLDTQYFPLRVSIVGKVLKVSCGVDHTVALVRNLI